MTASRALLEDLAQRLGTLRAIAETHPTEAGSAAQGAMIMGVIKATMEALATDNARFDPARFNAAIGKARDAALDVHAPRVAAYK